MKRPADHADIPPAVLQFILKRINTVSELETLLIVSAEQTREWTAEEIAALIYVAPSSAAAILHELKRQRLVSSSDDESARFRFSPADENERDTVFQTAVAYRTYLIPIATLIHMKASRPVQEFARAFSLKKDE